MRSGPCTLSRVAGSLLLPESKLGSNNSAELSISSAIAVNPGSNSVSISTGCRGGTPPTGCTTFPESLGGLGLRRQRLDEAVGAR